MTNNAITEQNERMFLEMKKCSENAASISWLPNLLQMYDQKFSEGLLILLSGIPNPLGHLWYGTWLANDKTFYEFVVATTRDEGRIVDVESWVTSTPEVSANKEGVGKTPAYIAIELLSRTENN
ncbi:MAG: hypothetical protein K6L80_11160 [Agarilytica sp.]